MENVHKTASRPWIAKHLSVRKFRDEWDQLLQSKNRDCPNLKDLISNEEYLAIEEECSVAAMRCHNQHSIEIGPNPVIPGNIQLETLRLQQEDLEKRKTDPHYESTVYQSTRFNNYPLQQNVIATGLPEDNVFIPIKQPEVVLTVQIFRPEKRTRSTLKNPHSRFAMFHVDQEFVVLGSQYLTELRDKIDCVSDKAIPGDYSEDPNQPIDIICKDLYKSGFFYIDGVFYNDMRHPDCRDYSQTILDWTKIQQRGIGPFRKLRMEFSKFIDLEIQLGYPYVYVHQGNCEHFIVFSDLLMFGPHHRRNKKEYPLHVTLKPKKRIFCMVCHVHTADWIVYNSKRVPETPFYFCKLCFLSFNYDKNNQKIEDIEAYHHIDRSTIS